MEERGYIFTDGWRQQQVLNFRSFAVLTVFFQLKKYWIYRPDKKRTFRKTTFRLFFEPTQNFQFSSKICWLGGECHLAADSAKQDAVALLSHWCSNSTWQDETDPAAWIQSFAALGLALLLCSIAFCSFFHKICFPYIVFKRTRFMFGFGISHEITVFLFPSKNCSELQTQFLETDRQRNHILNLKKVQFFQ